MKHVRARSGEHQKTFAVPPARAADAFRAAGFREVDDYVRELSAMTRSPCEIVDASPADAEAILVLQKLAYASEARRYDDWTIPPLVETIDSVCLQIAQHVVLKAMVDGQLAGSVRGVVTDGVCEVCRLSVDPALQRRGVGSALLVAIERRFPSIKAFELFTGNRSVENLRLYERHGYRHVRTTVLSPAVSLVFLRKAGPSSPDSVDGAPLSA